MKKFIISFILSAIVVLGSMALIAQAAPTSTIVQNLQITALSGGGTLCLHILNTGLVQTAPGDCGSGSGSFTTSSINNVSSTYWFIVGDGSTTQSSVNGVTTTIGVKPGVYYFATNPSGYLSSSTGLNYFYPSSTNPSGYITSSTGLTYFFPATSTVFLSSVSANSPLGGNGTAGNPLTCVGCMGTGGGLSGNSTSTYIAVYSASGTLAGYINLSFTSSTDILNLQGSASTNPDLLICNFANCTPIKNQGFDLVFNQTSSAIANVEYGVSGGTNSPGVSGMAARGSSTVPTAVQAGDILLSLNSFGYTGTNFATSSNAAIREVASGTFTNSSNPVYISFSVTPNNSISKSEVARITGDGRLGIGTTAPNTALDVNGNITDRNVTSSPFLATDSTGKIIAVTTSTLKGYTDTFGYATSTGLASYNVGSANGLITISTTTTSAILTPSTSPTFTNATTTGNFTVQGLAVHNGTSTFASTTITQLDVGTTTATTTPLLIGSTTIQYGNMFFPKLTAGQYLALNASGQVVGSTTVNPTGIASYNVGSTDIYTKVSTTTTSASITNYGVDTFNGATGTPTYAVKAGTGLSVVTSTASSTVSLTVPISVANGGRGTTTASALGSIEVGLNATSIAPFAVGTNGYVLQASSSAQYGVMWAPTSSLGISGSGGTPAGSSGNIQYNNGGAFGGIGNTSTTPSSTVIIGSNTIISSDPCSGGNGSRSGTTMIRTFNTSSTLTCSSAISVNYLIVGGGGGGGAVEAGGGGAGGMATGTMSLSATSYPVTIGSGGIGALFASANPTSGTTSTFNGVSMNGGGAGGDNGVSTKAPQVGASGGGGYGAGGSTIAGAAGIGGQGNAGGSGTNTANYGAGGGGGISDVGGNGTGSAAGNGGAGATSTISGVAVCYAGGGGGGKFSDGTAGTATCGGGAGGLSTDGTAGTANTGGGGGGGGNSGGSHNGGNGGLGVVIVSYSLPTTTPSLSDNLVISGHILVAANTLTTPTLSSCGTGSVIRGSDMAGTVTMGTGSPTACTITWASTFNDAPTCGIEPFTPVNHYISVSTAALTVNFYNNSTSTGSAVATTTTGFTYYACFDN